MSGQYDWAHKALVDEWKTRRLMMIGKIEIYGAFDDLIEIEGVLAEEFNCYGAAALVALSDGTLLRVNYSDEGVWKIERVRSGSAELVSHTTGDPTGDYTDRLTLMGDFAWALIANEDESMVVYP